MSSQFFSRDAGSASQYTYEAEPLFVKKVKANRSLVENANA